MKATVKIDRRQLLQGVAAGSLTLGALSLYGCGGRSDGTGNRSWPDPDIILNIAPDGEVTIFATRAEMGQGIRTALPMVVADELEAERERVRVQQAVGHPRYGDQNTDASASIRKFYQPMRETGAAMREMLIAAAARRWEVDPGECLARRHEVIHRTTDRRLGYGELASVAARLPVPDNPTLKSPEEFRYIGNAMRSVDSGAIVRGKAVYGIDTTVAGMKFAAVRRCPVIGGRLSSFDDAGSRQVPGVREVVTIEGPAGASGFSPLAGVAVVANDTWAAFRGRDALEVTWEDGDNAGFDSNQAAAALRETALRPGRVVREEGDVDARFTEPGEVVEAVYELPLLAHAPMEPPACVAAVTAGACEVWAPVQSPQRTRDEIAKYLDLAPEDVTVNVTLLGGAFGRKAKPDFVLEAVAVSRAIEAPVKLTWSREDDLRHGYYHANSAQYFKAVLGDAGMPEAWLQRTVFPSIQSTFDADARAASTSELRQGFLDNPYRIPNLRCENGEAETGVRIGWLRSVCNIFHSFSMNSFVDELAIAANSDPLSFRLRLLGERRFLPLEGFNEDSPFPYDTGRLVQTLETVARASGWGKDLPRGRGQGIAVHRSFYSYVAQVVEASVDDAGDVTVHSVDCAVDCGQVVNPDTVVAQIEGAVIFALSFALHGAVTVQEGRVRQGNFNDYPVLRIHETPEIRVHLVPSREAPTGIGEPGVPPLAPALCGAIQAATGRRIRRLPVANQLRNGRERKQ